jgi:hypothetical protein
MSLQSCKTGRVMKKGSRCGDCTITPRDSIDELKKGGENKPPDIILLVSYFVCVFPVFDEWSPCTECCIDQAGSDSGWGARTAFSADVTLNTKARRVFQN